MVGDADLRPLHSKSEMCRDRRIPLKVVALTRTIEIYLTLKNKPLKESESSAHIVQYHVQTGQKNQRQRCCKEYTISERQSHRSDKRIRTAKSVS